LRMGTSDGMNDARHWGIVFCGTNATLRYFECKLVVFALEFGHFPHPGYCDLISNQNVFGYSIVL
jgi:hypothetical protein